MIFFNNKYREMALMALCSIFAIFFWFLLLYNEKKINYSSYTFEVLLPNNKIYYDTIKFKLEQRNNFINKNGIQKNISLKFSEFVSLKNNLNAFFVKQLNIDKISYLNYEITYSKPIITNAVYSKMVEIMPNKKLKFDKNGSRQSFQFYPDSIEIYGEKTVLDNITNIYTSANYLYKENDSIIELSLDNNGQNFFTLSSKILCTIKKINQKEIKIKKQIQSINTIEKYINIETICDENISNINDTDFKIQFLPIVNDKNSKKIVLLFDSTKYNKVTFYPKIIHIYKSAI
jgi:hypothetical protein